MPTLNYQELGLNPDWNDDVLIASVLQYKADCQDNDSVILVTQDSGPRIIASQLGIKVIELSEECKLPIELDPLEAENRELRREISVFKNALPRLVVSFADSEKVENHSRFYLPAPLRSIDDEIARRIGDLKTKFPKQQPPKETPLNRSSQDLSVQEQLAFLAEQSNLQSFNSIPLEEYDRYNQGVDSYLKSYEHYLRTTAEWQAAIRRSIRFEIEIRNNGTAPAEDVDVHFHFPDGFLLFSEEDLGEFPDRPKEPRPPKKPRTRKQMMSYDRPSIPILGLDLLEPSSSEFEIPSSFSIERTNSYDVHDHFPRIKHGDIVALPEIFLTFDSYETASSFSCQYVIRPSNLPTPIVGELHFVIEKGSSAEDGISSQ